MAPRSLLGMHASKHLQIPHKMMWHILQKTNSHTDFSNCKQCPQEATLADTISAISYAGTQCWKTIFWHWNNATLHISSIKHLANTWCGRWMWEGECVLCNKPNDNLSDVFLSWGDCNRISYLDMHQKFMLPLQEDANLPETRQSTAPFSFRCEGISQR